MKMNVLIALFGSASAIKINMPSGMPSMTANTATGPATGTNSTASGGQHPATGTNSTASGLNVVPGSPGSPTGPPNSIHPHCATPPTVTAPTDLTCTQTTHPDWISTPTGCRRGCNAPLNNGPPQNQGYRGMVAEQCATTEATAPKTPPPATFKCPQGLYPDWISTPTGCRWGCNTPQNNGPPQNGPSGPPNQGQHGMVAQQCADAATATKGGPPATLQCPQPLYPDWIHDASGKCGWGCNGVLNNGPPHNGPPGNYGPPSPQDQANGFVDGFYHQCDADANALLTRQEIRDCVVNELKQQRKQLNEMMQFQAKQFRDLSNMVWNGASAEPGVVKKAGVSRDNIVSWASANWNQIEQVMQQRPPDMDRSNGESNGESNGDSYGENGPPHNGTAAGNSTAQIMDTLTQGAY